MSGKYFHSEPQSGDVHARNITALPHIESVRYTGAKHIPRLSRRLATCAAGWTACRQSCERWQGMDRLCPCSGHLLPLAPARR